MTSNTRYLRRLLFAVRSLLLVTALLLPTLCSADNDGWKRTFPGIALRSESLTGDYLLRNLENPFRPLLEITNICRHSEISLRQWSEDEFAISLEFNAL